MSSQNTNQWVKYGALFALLILLLFIGLPTQTNSLGAVNTVAAGQDLDNMLLASAEQRCATGDADASGYAIAEQARANFRASAAYSTVDCSEEILIPTYFHVIHHNNGTGQLTMAEVNAQMDVLNNAFAGITFVLAQVTYTANNAWFNDMESNETAIANALASPDPQSELNIYTGDFAAGLLGYVDCIPGYFPTAGAACTGNKDGAWLLYSSLPGGTAQNYNEGDTASHEVGHWLGLPHIWGDGGCGVDDGIADTPLSDAPNFGCPTGHQSCGSTDDITNFMDYTYDSCMDHFTPGQDDAMCDAINMYRPNISNEVLAVDMSSMESVSETPSSTLMVVTLVAGFLAVASGFVLRQRASAE